MRCPTCGLENATGVKREKTTIFRLVRAIPRRERRHQALRGGLTRFLGRHTDLALLRERYEQARNRRGQVVFVAGEAGIGKSRLVHEFRRALVPGALGKESPSFLSAQTAIRRTISVALLLS
jgi:hypothetical protein